jgi:bifunctional DNase/RNase
MATVRIAHAEPRPGRLDNGEFQTLGWLVVLADDAGHRAVPVWVRGQPGWRDLAELVESAAAPAGEIITADAPEELTDRLLRAAGAAVTEVDIDVTEADVAELSPQAAVARIGLSGPIGFPGFVIMLADDAGRRELPIWVQGFSSRRLTQLFEPATDQEHAGTAEARTADELTARLLRAAGASVTGVDIDDLGLEVPAARIALAGPAGTSHVTARVVEGLAVAITAGATVRVADAVMDRLAIPRPDDDGPVPLPEPEAALAVLSPSVRPRYEPRNLNFADGLERWRLGGSFIGHASHAHWQDYSAAAENGIAALSSTVPQPAGWAFLGQEVFADDYRGAVITFRGEFRRPGAAGTGAASRAGLFLRVAGEQNAGNPVTDPAAASDPDNTLVPVPGGRDWTSRQVTARVGEDSRAVVFGVFLAGHGRIEMRNPELTRRA